MGTLIPPFGRGCRSTRECCSMPWRTHVMAHMRPREQDEIARLGARGRRVTVITDVANESNGSNSHGKYGWERRRSRRRTGCIRQLVSRSGARALRVRGLSPLPPCHGAPFKRSVEPRGLRPCGQSAAINSRCGNGRTDHGRNEDGGMGRDKRERETGTRGDTPLPGSLV